MEPDFVEPPLIMTAPSGSKVAVWPKRGAESGEIVGAAVQPMAGQLGVVLTGQ